MHIDDDGKDQGANGEFGLEAFPLCKSNAYGGEKCLQSDKKPKKSQLY